MMESPWAIEEMIVLDIFDERLPEFLDFTRTKRKKRYVIPRTQLVK
jgi:hypothetical protein